MKFYRIYQILSISLCFFDYVTSNELFIRKNNEPDLFQDKTIIIHEFKTQFRLICIKKCLLFYTTCQYFQFNKSKNDCKIYNSIEKKYFFGKNDIYQREKLLPRVLFLNGTFLDQDQLSNMSIIINLSRNELSQIGPFAFEKCNQTQILDLSFNNLTKLYSKSFYGMVKLNTLNLSFNQISQLESDVFAGLPLLTNLDLKNNNLRFIGGNTFYNLPQLQSLYLEFNQIESIEKYTFKNLEKIKKIYLKNNNLKSLEPIFFNLSSFNFLDVSLNQIKIVHNDTFKSLNKLISVDISFNQISELNADTLNGAYNLEKLVISFNQIKKIDSNFFNKFPRLKFLELSNNNLSFIEPDIFIGLAKLEILKLFNCNLISLDLNSLVNLKFLHLGVNKINFFSQNLSSLTELILNSNPLENLNYSLISSQNSKLVTLGISFCKLKYVELDLLRQFSYLKTLSIAGNFLKLNNETFNNFNMLNHVTINKDDIPRFKSLYPNITFVEFFISSSKTI